MKYPKSGRNHILPQFKRKENSSARKMLRLFHMGTFKITQLLISVPTHTRTMKYSDGECLKCLSKIHKHSERSWELWILLKHVVLYIHFEKM